MPFLMTPAELIDVFRSPTYRPPVLPSIAMELHALTRQIGCDHRSVLRLLERDAMVAARVLRTAQSPMFAGRMPVRCLDDAVRRLGLETLSQIVLEVTMGMTLFRAAGYEEAMERMRKHSTATAYVARAVAYATKQPTELAFMCGLLHDIGVAAALLVFAGGSTSTRPSIDEVWPVIQPIHEEVAGLLAKLWNLPPEVHKAMFHHHPQHDQKLAQIVFIADAMVIELGLGLESEVEPARVEHARHALGFPREAVGDLMTYAQSVASQIE